MKSVSNVWKLYGFRFFYSLIPAYVIERLYWEERGMTIQMVIYAEIIFAVTVLLFEVPSGILADRWGRKRLIVVSAALGVCEFFLLLFATSFWHFALVVFLAAIGMSASSGAENALLYDSLLLKKRERSYEKYYGRLNALEIVATMLAALSGSWLAVQFGFTFNYWLSFVAMWGAVFFAFWLKEPAVKTKTEESESMPLKGYVAAFVRLYKQHPNVIPVLTSGMVVGASVNFIDEFWQLYLDRLQIPILFFGMFSAALYFLKLPGNLLAYQLKKRVATPRLLLFIMSGIVFGLFIMAVSPNIYGLLAMGLVYLVAGMIEPLTSGYLQHRISSNVRATMGSVQSMGENAVIMLAGLGFGYWSSKGDIFGGYGFLAVLCGVFLMYYVWRQKAVRS
ncbi:MFS transporter [Aureibacillus halotolerans]|uniref:Nitrate/nitrite transporter NarK n=1 Tax=Aureibacillus halotolerans TaxID=1508390 RepID=A0A4R6UDM3_9BACI|nr:MFS transporter [Aureibacillus halotolerans]TDQ41194.1 nitrate/nitrite transporter NarK [Aureibacillus halotolerans]